MVTNRNVNYKDVIILLASTTGKVRIRYNDIDWFDYIGIVETVKKLGFVEQLFCRMRGRTSVDYDVFSAFGKDIIVKSKEKKEIALGTERDQVAYLVNTTLPGQIRTQNSIFTQSEAALKDVDKVVELAKTNQITLPSWILDTVAMYATNRANSQKALAKANKDLIINTKQVTLLSKRLSDLQATKVANVDKKIKQQMTLFKDAIKAGLMKKVVFKQNHIEITFENLSFTAKNAPECYEYGRKDCFCTRSVTYGEYYLGNFTVEMHDRATCGTFSCQGATVIPLTFSTDTFRHPHLSLLPCTLGCTNQFQAVFDKTFQTGEFFNCAMMIKEYIQHVNHHHMLTSRLNWEFLKFRASPNGRIITPPNIVQEAHWKQFIEQYKKRNKIIDPPIAEKVEEVAVPVKEADIVF